MVNVALTGEGLASCPQADLNGDGLVSVEEIIVAVNNALDGCSVASRPMRSMIVEVPSRSLPGQE